jgi:hypothetical protein
MENCSSGETLVGMYKLKEAMEKFCSDLLASHQRKCECALAGMVTWRFSSCRRWWNHYSWVQGPSTRSGHGPPGRTFVGHCRSSCGPRALHKPGHANTMQAGHELGREWIRPIGLRFVLLFSEYIQILSKFKNSCRIHLNSENYETNFVG